MLGRSPGRLRRRVPCPINRGRTTPIPSNETDNMPERESFIGEPVVPKPGTFDMAAMARGEPGLPRVFSWRGTEYRVAALMENWKSTGPSVDGGTEQYLRKHWYRIRTTDGREMEICFERQARSSNERKKRWWLFGVSEEDSPRRHGGRGEEEGD